MQRYMGRSVWGICDMTSLSLTPDCGPSHHSGDFGSCWMLGVAPRVWRRADGWKGRETEKLREAQPWGGTQSLS